MRKFIVYIMVWASALSCGRFMDRDPYEKTLCTLSVKAVYPEDYAQYAREGVSV